MGMVVDDRAGSLLTAADEVSSRDSMRLPVAYAAPRTEREQAICAAFSSVLQVSPIGRDDEFYDLGGDSLSGEGLSIEIERTTGQAFPISKLFRYGTPAAIAELLGGATKESKEAIRFFVVHGRGGYTSLRPEFRAGLAKDRQVTMFELPGIRGGRRPIWDIRELAAIYVRQIQEEQPEGPVRLAAFCAGSFIAFEMASQLRDAGRALDRLVLIDPLAPAKVTARHRAESELEASPGSISAIEYLRRTGRWRGNRAIDAVVVWVGQRREALMHFRQMRENKVAFVKKYQGLGFKNWPRAVLMSMYRYAWPEPFAGRVHILGSAERVREMVAPGSIWRRLAPHITIEVLSHKHSDIGYGGSGGRFAVKLEEILASQP